MRPFLFPPNILSSKFIIMIKHLRYFLSPFIIFSGILEEWNNKYASNKEKKLLSIY